MMQTKTRTSWIILAATLLVIGLLVASFGPRPTYAARTLALLPSSTACTGTGTVTCELWATTGLLNLPGGVSIPVWGYSDTAVGAAQVPGPVLIANQGDTVTVTLHNNLSETTALHFEGQDMIPDLSGIAAGSQDSYTFTPANPGTFLYEAGLLPNAQHQVAMGLYGALIVRPAGAPNQAYADPATAFDDEALLVLSEIDPALNNSAAPAAFDMRKYKPKYWLINGKAYPDTDPFLTAAGNIVLLRYVNAGQQDHTMGLLGIYQQFLSRAGAQLPYPRNLVSEILSPGQSADAIVVVPPLPSGSPPLVRYPLYDASLLLHNNGAAGFGGMLTFLEVPNGPPGGDTTGPAATNLGLDPSKTNGTGPVLLTATISDAASGNSNVVAAEYFVGAVGVNGTGCAMTGSFGIPTVTNVSATIPTTGATAPCVDLATLPHGNHTFYIHGQDANGNWGSFNFIVLNLDKTGPATGAIALTPAFSKGDVPVSIQATGDDSMTGGSNVTTAEYSITGSAITGTLAPNQAASVVSLNGSILAAAMVTLSEGGHTLSIRSQDALGNWGDYATAILAVDKSGPVTSNVNAFPNPNNGTLGVNPITPSVRVNAQLNDPLAKDLADPNVVEVNSSIKMAEGFIDTVGAQGTGFAFTPNDGAFNSPSELAYAFIPLSQINALSAGSHTIYVRGKDAAGNWGATASTVLVIDKTKPTVSNVVATPNPTAGQPVITLTANATDTATNIAMAEWFEGVDPGVGNATPMAAVDTAFDSSNESLTASIDVTTWTNGAYTLSVRAKDAAGNWSNIAVVILTVSDPPPPLTGLLYFSTVGNVAVQGVAGPFDDADIYNWDGVGFSRTFDASLAGLPGSADIDGLVMVQANKFYVSFNVNTGTNVPGVGLVQDEDIVLYDNGAWSLYFDGSAHGLAASNGQDLDAIDVVGGDVYFSTVGNASIPGVGGPYDDADIYRWDGASFSRVFDASAAGLPGNANVDGLNVVDGDTMYFSFLRDLGTTVPTLGLAQDEDVVLRDAGLWSLYFDGSAHGLGTAAGQDLDAFHVP
ncbi:MAG TPA: multicopper oxidase domain-containing protein [Anaerolineales bacterium]|nr:multicopper oxidase domain-containing protein [Anaerolineales bacterium]